MQGMVDTTRMPIVIYQRFAGDSAVITLVINSAPITARITPLTFNRNNVNPVMQYIIYPAPLCLIREKKKMTNEIPIVALRYSLFPNMSSDENVIFARSANNMLSNTENAKTNNRIIEISSDPPIAIKEYVFVN
jgi:ABC-type polar amino acid transport system ATPase subunit